MRKARLQINTDKSAGRRIWDQSVGLALAEITSATVSLGVVAVADSIAPNMMKHATNYVAHEFIEPHLDQLEKVIGTFCRLEECKTDEKMPREERAQRLARATVLFGAAFVPSLITKLAVRRGVNEYVGLGDSHPWWKIWKANKMDQAIFAWDEGVHLGAIALLNMGTAKHTDSLIRHTTSLLESFGLPKKRAHDMATMFAVWELPNIAGYLGAEAKIIHSELKGKGTHVQRLMSEIPMGSEHAK